MAFEGEELNEQKSLHSMAVMNLRSRKNFMMAASLAMVPCVYLSGDIEMILKHRSVSEN